MHERWRRVGAVTLFVLAGLSVVLAAIALAIPASAGDWQTGLWRMLVCLVWGSVLLVIGLRLSRRR